MSNGRILLVDDEKDFVETLAKRLRKRDYSVETAVGGEEALVEVAAHTFDVIVLDLKMPGMDGVETLKKIFEKNSDQPVIMLTGHGTVAESVQAMKEGAVDFLEKPADFNELLVKIGKASENYHVLMEERSVEKIEKILEDKGW